MRSSVLLIAALGMLAACEAAPTSGAHWREVGSLDKGMIPFVEVDAAYAKDGSVYRDAANQLCSRRCTQVGFFLPGDIAPPSGSLEEFYQAGGWANYAPAAIYSADRSGFTKWDCVKAGVEGAPLDALCGKGEKQEFDAVLRMASRDGWTTGCRLPATNNRALLHRYFATLPQAKRDQLAAAYDHMLELSRTGPDSRADCGRLRWRVVAWNRSARAFLARRMAGRLAAGPGAGAGGAPSAR